MRYYKGYIALSETCDVPVLLHVRNARALCFDQLRELLSHEMLAVIVRSLRWRVARLEKVGLVARFNEQRFLGRPVYRITQQGLECLESRGHCLVSMPSDTEQILHPSKIAHALELVNIHLAFARTGLLRSWKTDLEITSRNLIATSGASKDYDGGGSLRYFERAFTHCWAGLFSLGQCIHRSGGSGFRAVIGCNSE